MQTKEQVLARIKSMLTDDHYGSAQEWLMKEAARLLDQGAINFEEYHEDDMPMALPKVILVVALENLSKQYVLPKDFRKAHKDMANLRHF